MSLCAVTKISLSLLTWPSTCWCPSAQKVRYVSLWRKRILKDYPVGELKVKILSNFILLKGLKILLRNPLLLFLIFSWRKSPRVSVHPSFLLAKGESVTHVIGEFGKQELNTCCSAPSTFSRLDLSVFGIWILSTIKMENAVGLWEGGLGIVQFCLCLDR